MIFSYKCNYLRFTNTIYRTTILNYLHCHKKNYDSAHRDVSAQRSWANLTADSLPW